jgi:hypothetical protein
MNDPPCGALSTKHDGSTCEPLGVAQLECDEHDAWREGLNA